VTVAFVRAVHCGIRKEVSSEENKVRKVEKK
jgi:hypothetical protein